MTYDNNDGPIYSVLDGKGNCQWAGAGVNISGPWNCNYNGADNTAENATLCGQNWCTQWASSPSDAQYFCPENYTLNGCRTSTPYGPTEIDPETGYWNAEWYVSIEVRCCAP